MTSTDRKAFLAGVEAGRRTSDASRPTLTEEQARCRHCRAPLPDHTPTCAVVHIAQEDGFPTISAAYEQWVTRNNGEPRGEAPPVPADATGGLGPEPGTPASHVSIPRAALAALVKATQYEPDVRVEREIARHALQQAVLAAEPARTDPLYARVLAEAPTWAEFAIEEHHRAVTPSGLTCPACYAATGIATPCTHTPKEP